MPDRFPDDLFEQIRQLTARVDQLEAQLQQRPGVTKASQGWRMADMTIPSVGSGEIHIGSNGGDFFVSTTSGTKSIPGVANNVNIPDINPIAAPSNYTLAWGQNVVSMIVSDHNALVNLRLSLQSAGFIGF
ncbi:hypothetical protein ABZ897_00945 [Nonomuraea sp. NPDC046802]|uniref:hypothetical protein n=1 Tax=Nonomuraea sp. NPDC046802 TaxID=3154919 RepID=UPI0033DCD855